MRTLLVEVVIYAPLHSNVCAYNIEKLNTFIRHLILIAISIDYLMCIYVDTLQFESYYVFKLSDSYVYKTNKNSFKNIAIEIGSEMWHIQRVTSVFETNNTRYSFLWESRSFERKSNFQIQNFEKERITGVKHCATLLVRMDDLDP